MEPLKQWICDKCGEIIKRPEDVYVIWNEDSHEKLNEIHIVHHNNRSEDKIIGCDNQQRKFPLSASLSDFIGDKGLVKLLSLVDPGPYHSKEYKDRIASKRAFLEFFRRVQIPYYEEARLYWNQAIQDGLFSGANEVWIYLPSTLKLIIEKYKDNNK